MYRDGADPISLLGSQVTTSGAGAVIVDETWAVGGGVQDDDGSTGGVMRVGGVDRDGNVPAVTLGWAFPDAQPARLRIASVATIPSVSPRGMNNLRLRWRKGAQSALDGTYEPDFQIRRSVGRNLPYLEAAARGHPRAPERDTFTPEVAPCPRPREAGILARRSIRSASSPRPSERFRRRLAMPKIGVTHAVVDVERWLIEK